MLQTKRIIKSILKYRISSSLTLLSLIISFTGIIILTLYVSFEKSYDRFHKNANSIYRVELVQGSSFLPGNLGPIIKQNIPETKAVTRIASYNGYVTTPKLDETNTKFSTNTYFADSTFFEMFSFPLTLGDKATALTNPHSAVISETLSQKLFGSANPIGQNILFQKITYKVTGVMKDMPKNSSFQADCILPYSIYTAEKKYNYLNDWSEWSFNTFVLLQPGTNPDVVESKIQKTPDLAEFIKNINSDNKIKGSIFYLRPLKDIHYTFDGFFSYTNPKVLNVLILLIAILTIMGAVNFVNFSTSQAPLRAKALAINRVIGASRLSTMHQIIAESVILSLVAMILSLVIYRLSFHFIESVFSIQGLNMNGRYVFLLLFLAFALLFGILAGFYPSKYITSPSLAQSVKGNIQFSGKGKSLRNILIVVQFIFTIGLIASSFIIEKQLSYWHNFNIGINKDNVVYLSTSEELRNHYKAFADELMKNRDIVNYTYTQFIPGNVQMGWGLIIDGQQISFKCWPVDDRFIDFFGLKIDNGRKFLSGENSDIDDFILNEKAVSQFGWKNPLERNITGFSNEPHPVIGVVKNFNFSSLEEDIPAMAFWRTNERKNILLLRLSSGNYTQTIKYIETTAHQFDPKNQFEVKFLDDSLNKLYSKEEKIAHFIEFVALWTILLSITGLLGLVIFVSRDRTKEIGIRKVNGATISEVIMMLNKNFVKWVVIAFVIATPISYYAMNKWLENFAYKTALSWWIFALAGLLALGIALLTVSWQSWRAATKNPVEALRYE